jgi:hypothetical protein
LVAAMIWCLAALAACGPTAQVANPPANTLLIYVGVFDRETVDHTPSDTTLLYITLTRHPPGGGILSSDETVKGTDARTLECNGVAMQSETVPGTINRDQQNSVSYSGSVPPQTDHYTCTYYWNQGAQQATLTIPVMIPNLPHIQAPASRAMVQVPVSGEHGVTVTYAPAANSGVSVTATASDYDKRAATSDQQNDDGTALIDPQRFPPAFSVGWGMISLTRSFMPTDLSKVGSNSAFASVHLSQYEQADQIPVFWI